jgi:DNA replication protein DnaC
MEIIEDRYGRGSTLITSQLPVEAWHEAILDRIVHNAYRLALEGPSMRKPEAEAAVSTSDTTSTATTQTKSSRGARK